MKNDTARREIESLDYYLQNHTNDYSEESHTAMMMAIKALEQESVLDKIRAEVEELDGKYVIGDYGTYGEHSPKYVLLWDVLQIINKYKAEGSDKE